MAPIALPTNTAQPKAAAVRPAADATKRAFALPELVVAEDGAEAEPTEAPASLQRSKLAAGGKALPVRARSSGKKDKDEYHKAADPAFAWVATLLAPPVDAPAGIALLARGANATPVVTGDSTPPAAAATEAALASPTRGTDLPALKPMNGSQVLPAEQETALAPTPFSAVATAPAIDAAQANLPNVAPTGHPQAAMPEGGIAVRGQADLPPPTRSPAGAAATPDQDSASSAPAQPNVAEPAARVFAKALLATQPGASAHPAPRKDDPAGLAPLAIAAAEPIRSGVIHAAVAPQREALDLTQDQGLQRMIDRIETLRDAADANDTRIRLTPAGLGTIDVAVRRDGDTVHVHFSAEQAATRTLITDAQPRLAELAEARGIRLGETSVGGGAADLARQQHQQRFAGQPTPPLAPRAAAATETTDADSRVA